MKEAKHKVYFLPYHRGVVAKNTKKEEPFAVVDTTYGYISFSSSTLRQLGYVSKFMKFYYEPDRRIIGWKLAAKLQQEEMKSWKLVFPNKVGQFRTSVRGILSTFGTGLKPAYKAEIIKYTDKDLLSEHDTYHFIQLTKENGYVKSKKRRGNSVERASTSQGTEEQVPSVC